MRVLHPAVSPYKHQEEANGKQIKKYM